MRLIPALNRPSASTRQFGLILCAIGTVLGSTACRPEQVPEETQVLEETQAPAAAPVVFSVAEPDLLPENVAWDPQTEAYFLGSTRKGKILRVQGSEVGEFKAPREDGLWMVIGMKVDAERRSLWVCSSQGGNLIGDTIDGNTSAGLFRFDIDTGELLDRWVVGGDGEDHFLNDLVVAEDGRVFVTYMFDTPAIWSAEPEGDFQPVVQLAPESYPNGIALDDAAQVLYVATSQGLLRLPLDGSNSELVGAPDVSVTRGIDGLYLHNNHLIAVRPDPGSVWAYQLDASGSGIVASGALVEGHPRFFGPTTGVVVGEELHFVANAQFSRVADDGSLPPVSELHDPVVLGLPLPSLDAR